MGIDEEELIFPVMSNNVSIIVSILFPDFVDSSDILSERTIEEIALILNEKFLNIFNSCMKKWESRLIKLIKT